ncbi:MAG: OmpP1/FadL family transporter [Panacagrimonas sp.]
MTLCLIALTWPQAGSAGLSIFEHGNGIKSQGVGGVSYVLGDESTSLVGNPAHVYHLDEGFDIGINMLSPNIQVRYRGNAAGPDRNFKNHSDTFLPVPQGGWIGRLGPDWKVGVAAFTAGLISDFDSSPYARFGSDPRANLQLTNAGAVVATAVELFPNQTLGASLSLGYQTIRVNGVQFAQGVSESPENVTNRGKDGAPNVGFTLGWLGRFGDHWSAALAYRSKTFTEKHDEYAGLLPDQGRFEAPQIYGAGIAFKPVANWTFAAEWQHYHHSSEPAFDNNVSALNDGHLFGTKQGPGFGYENIDAIKLGVEWQARADLILRAGFLTSNQAGRPGNTFINALGPITITDKYTAGLTYTLRGWELSSYVAHSPHQKVSGENSIPPALGGGEMDLSFEFVSFGFALGRGFGQQRD